MNVHAKKYLTFIFIALAFNSRGQSDTTWQTLKQWFSPPSNYKNIFDNYSDPMLFYNGKKVTSKRDWKKRREEIKK